MNHMFLQKHITPRQKQAIIICLHKSINTQTPDDYRQISLLKTEYKLLARILARRLKTILAEQLQNNQFCGVLGNSVLEAISCARDVIAHAEATGTPLCVLTLDFQQAFDLSPINTCSTFYKSMVLVRGLWNVYTPYVIRQRLQFKSTGLWWEAYQFRAVSDKVAPQRDTLRLVLHPLLRVLEDSLPNIQMGHIQHSPVIANSDDVKVFITNPEDFITIQQAVQTFEQAAGVCFNPRKSKALAIGAWAEPPAALGIDLYERVSILGVDFGPTIAISLQDSWARVTRSSGSGATGVC
jgi:hypothetical protein